MSKPETPGSEFDPLPGEAVTPEQRRAEELAREHSRQYGAMPVNERPPLHADYNGWEL
ncbi:hypothetical protein ACFYO8_10730 [Micromonospora sp. NPDC005257]|uniref:hypothetical protein n=1 Tax=Micromonospora sp. NPDC005257 TaxID=3364230 RepID=UPI00369B841C